MITTIEPERGGEAEDIVRLVLDIPCSPTELLALRDWLAEHGWSIEVDQIDDYLAGEDDYRYHCQTCDRIGTTDDGITGVGDDCPDEDCDGTIEALS